jgi:hypothetical protein
MRRHHMNSPQEARWQAFGVSGECCVRSRVVGVIAMLQQLGAP